MEDKKKRGRPKKNSSRIHDVHLRLTDEEMKAIRDGASECGENYSDFLRKSATLRLNVMEAQRISATERIELSKYTVGYEEDYGYDYYEND